MVHNGIEYGVMAAYAEGFDILKRRERRQKHARHRRRDDAAAQPGALPVRPQPADVAEVWRRGSVIASWLLDLTATALAETRAFGVYGRVSDSGEGRWTIKAAIEEAVPAPVLRTALYQRFTSRVTPTADKLLSAMRFQFGGHLEKPAK